MLPVWFLASHLLIAAICVPIFHVGWPMIVNAIFWTPLMIWEMYALNRAGNLRTRMIEATFQNRQYVTEDMTQAQAKEFDKKRTKYNNRLEGALEEYDFEVMVALSRWTLTKKDIIAKLPLVMRNAMEYGWRLPGGEH